MFKVLRRKIRKMFREFLVYHHSSLEFRAKVLTLMVSADRELSACEEETLSHIAHRIYSEDSERAELLIDTVKEFHTKIVTDNGLDLEDLVKQIDKEVRSAKQFCHKIDIELLSALQACAHDADEEEKLFQQRIMEFLENIRRELCSNES